MTRRSASYASAPRPSSRARTARRWLAGSLVPLFAASLGVSGGCNAEFCDIVDCGGGGNGPGNCAPGRPLDEQPDGCVLYVRADAADGNGTKERPFGTIGNAISALEGLGALAIAVCGTSEFEEDVTLPAGVSLYGGFDCADFSRDTSQSPTIEGSPDDAAIEVLAGSGEPTTIYLENFVVRAAESAQAGGSSIGIKLTRADARLSSLEVFAAAGEAGEAGPGGSSIGVLAVESSASFSEVSITTLEGGAGDDGTDGDTVGASGTDGSPAAAPTCGGSAGNPGSGSCGANVAGGAGGPGGSSGDGSAGQDGNPRDLGGDGGVGQDQFGPCQDGDPGNDGSHGEPGMGGQGVGTLSEAGFTPAETPDNSEPGFYGYGGGGGGGGKHNGTCGMPGGGGGGGGCGGERGTGGFGGGSSLAIASLTSTIRIVGQMTITLGPGGRGGNGGNGASGGDGGAGGVGGANGASTSCDGGRGGDGGDGGPGGGGTGGHSAGIAYMGSAPEADSFAVEQLPTEAAGGDGGSNSDGSAGAGAAGYACSILELSSETGGCD